MASSTTSVTRSAAFRAAADCESWSRLSSFATVREFWIQEGPIPLDAGGNTILHFLAMYGNAFVIQKLIDDDNGNNNSIVKCGDLFGRNDKGNTPLHEAVRFGRRNVVEILLREQESLVRARNCLGETPVYIAAACGHEDVFNHLIAKVDFDREMTRSTDSSNLLHAAVTGEHYGLAMSILESFPLLAQNPDEEGRTALYLLAQKSKSFRSGSFYSPHNFMSGSLIISVDFLAFLTYWFIPSMVYHSKHETDDVENQQQNRVNISKL
ncbi:ankyrin repeat-containing protein ITN1-like [Rhododendron vialii]|uniref:ankyrin repeat-containing protein ITN1-like n=1 Tax=Rhododendron vialii TaxID=182163 RepID=UPI0026601BBB|nr:ankyrin repeat-containing protein ITN1-like [Rhododendron vialii]XP_058220994.1 ankyrin repeat-containing protein ITN1-like [Rhododendron vialii]